MLKTLLLSEIVVMHNYSVEMTDSLERVKGHRTSLEQARQKGRITTRLQITIKPMVINKEETEFLRNWDRAIK